MSEEPQQPEDPQRKDQGGQDQGAQQPESLAEGTLMSHLLELRTRLMKAVIAWVIALIPCAYYSNALFTFMSKPIRDKLPKGSTLIATDVMSPFFTPFKLSMFAAVVLAMPYVLYQVWAFVAPGLYRHEKRFAIPLLATSVILFYCGGVFAYLVVFPIVFGFFAATTPQGVAMNTDITSYLDFVVRMFLGFGLAFEMPVAVVLLVRSGLVSMEKLKSNRSYVILGVVVIAACVTPPDALSMCTLALPMYLLYEGGLIMAHFLGKKPEQAESGSGGTA
ncbi:MAG TPA: twin-arginine translocase subunit TatC [Steroidobacteraceae bacterium]|nr:twin-arginine translocase subunit TatC [Steroidobacteraceae bacterium]